MRTTSRFLLLAGSLLLAATATAQTRYVEDVVIAPAAQLEVGLPGNDYVLGAVSLSLPTSSTSPASPGLQVRVGYEHFWNPSWSAGASLRVLRGDNRGYGDLPAGLAGNVVPGLFLRHHSQLGKFNFGQRLGAEYAATINEDEYAPENRGLVRLRLDLDRIFPLSEKLALRPRIAYEAAAYLRLQREEGQTKERVIDFGSLRGEVGLRLSPHIDITPWLASQSVYINSLPQYDANGKQVAGGRTNFVQPVAGLDFRFTISPSGASAERIQLPSQH